MTPGDRDEIKRHFDVVAEGVRSDIRLLAEGVATNSERLDRIDGRLDRVDGRLDGIDGRLDRVEGEVHALRDETRQGFTELRSQIRLSYSELDGRLTRLEQAHGTLESRVERLEAKLAS